MLANRGRAHPRTTPAMRDAEGLVQIQVRDVGPEPPRLGKPHECVQVRAIDIDLTAGVVHHCADIRDGRLEDAVRRGIGDHECRE